MFMFVIAHVTPFRLRVYPRDPSQTVDGGKRSKQVIVW